MPGEAWLPRYPVIERLEWSRILFVVASEKEWPAQLEPSGLASEKKAGGQFGSTALNTGTGPSITKGSVPELALLPVAWPRIGAAGKLGVFRKGTATAGVFPRGLLSGCPLTDGA